jgi:tetratricopeptide (TPR) repeat protein/4-amino-4-deoxy-L-arabinose transferase-like glycosyltransferase
MIKCLQDNTTKQERWFILLIVLISLGLRIGYLVEMSHTLLLTQLRLDELFHRNWARSISDGNIIGDVIFFRAPLYAYWLGLNFSIFGNSLIIPRLIQHFVGTLGIVSLYFLSRHLFGKRVAFWSSLILAIYPPLIYTENKLLFESILIPLIIIFFTFWYYCKKNPRPTFIFFLGLLLGIICITRPLFLPFILLFAIIITFSFKRSGEKKQAPGLGLLFIFGTLIVIAPVTVRNYIVGKEFALIASQGGLNFYLGNNPTADGFSSTMPGIAGNRWGNNDVEQPVAQKLGRKPTASEIDNYWRSEGFKFISSSPNSFFALLGKKLYYFWNSIEIPNNSSFYLYENYSKVLRYIPVGFWILGPLGLFGIWIALREKRGMTIVSFIAVYTILIIIFFVCDRFRLPIVPFLSIFAGLTIAKIWDLWRSHAKKVLVRWGSAIVILFIIVNINIAGFQRGNPAADRFAIGNLELYAGNYRNAISHYEKIPTARIAIPDVHLNWGTAEWRSGNYQSAILQFHKEIEFYPESYDAIANIAHAYAVTGNPQAAIRYSQQAIRLKPYSPIAYGDYAVALSELGRYSIAESTLTAFIHSYPQDVIYEESVLAGIQLMEGKTDTAEKTYRSILARIDINRQPGYEPEYQYSREYRIGGSWDLFKAKVNYSMGHIFVQRQNQDSAIYYFRQAVRLNPAFAEAWIDLGTSLQLSGDLTQADSSLQLGLHIQPGNFQGWYNYGLLMAAQNKAAMAESAFVKALTLNPGFTPAQRELSLIRDGR